MKAGLKIALLVTIMLLSSAVVDNAEMENLEILARNQFEYSTARDLKGITHTTVSIMGLFQKNCSNGLWRGVKIKSVYQIFVQGK